MAESLRRLVNIGSFSSLQDKLENWFSDYHLNTCDQNVSRCCEIIELNGRVQSQLFKLLNICAAEGGSYGGASALKSRLLPWLGSNYLGGGLVTPDTSLSVLAESAAKDRELAEVQDMYEKSLRDLESELKEQQCEAEDLRKELDETKDELASTQRKSASDKMFEEAEIESLRTKLRAAEDEMASLRLRPSVPEYEREMRRLRDEISALSGRRDLLLARGRLYPYYYPYYPYYYPENEEPIPSEERPADLAESLAKYRYLPRGSSPLAPEDPVQRARQAAAIQRFNDLFTQDRLDAMALLRRYSDDHENNQRIVFAAVLEAFAAARLAFRQFKTRVRSQLAITHTGPQTLEEAVQDYINRNNDLYDLPGLVADVLRALNRSARLELPAEGASVLQSFVRELCRLAWSCVSLAQPLDVSPAAAAELFDEYKYRRSYDSEYTAPLVNHHIWPCLMQGIKILVKGEANTRRGASLTRSRSGSPARGARSRSPSPSLRSSRRSGSPSRTLSGV